MCSFIIGSGLVLGCAKAAEKDLTGFGLAAAAEPSDGLRASSWRIRVS